MKRRPAEIGSPPQLWGSLFAIVALMSMPGAPARAQGASAQPSYGFTIQGTVHDATGKPVGDAAVRLERNGAPGLVEAKTNAAGVFGFSALGAGTYLISAEKSDLYSCATPVIASSQGERKQVDLVLKVQGGITTDSLPSTGCSTLTMEFADAPNFTVAGVTDWTAVGGHGSDSILRTSEDLARETAALKSDSAGSSLATSAADTSADLHRTSAELDEKQGDPLAAVHEFEQAVRLDPSERNYFEWGSELLLHRAVWQGQEVFAKGAEKYPKSARMLAALGTALFAGARYDDAALRLCEASDLDPADPQPYIFMGKIEMAAPAPLPCIEPKLARFAQEQPENALANYFYAMAIWKRLGASADKQALQPIESLLTKAVTVDAKCGDAYLQLGILDFSQHDFESAIGHYKKAIAADPQLGEAHYRLGVAYDRIGEPAKAQEEFQLHDQIESQQADAIERQRREVKQFLVVLPDQPAATQIR